MLVCLKTFELNITSLITQSSSAAAAQLSTLPTAPANSPTESSASSAKLIMASTLDSASPQAPPPGLTIQCTARSTVLSLSESESPSQSSPQYRMFSPDSTGARASGNASSTGSLSALAQSHGYASSTAVDIMANSPFFAGAPGFRFQESPVSGGGTLMSQTFLNCRNVFGQHSLGAATPSPTSASYPSLPCSSPSLILPPISSHHGSWSNSTNPFPHVSISSLAAATLYTSVLESPSRSLRSPTPAIELLHGGSGSAVKRSAIGTRIACVCIYVCIYSYEFQFQRATHRLH
jgi:hypothetical protein